MYGLEKEEKGKFEFDLEKQIKTDPKFAKDTLGLVEERIAETKNWMRKGSDEKNFHKMETLLPGYVALKKVLKRIAK